MATEDDSEMSAGPPGTAPYLRVVKGVAFLALALTFALLAYESLSKLWGHQDSPSWLYIAYGSVAAFLAVVCLAVAARSLRRVLLR